MWPSAVTAAGHGEEESRPRISSTRAIQGQEQQSETQMWVLEMQDRKRLQKQTISDESGRGQPEGLPVNAKTHQNDLFLLPKPFEIMREEVQDTPGR